MANVKPKEVTIENVQLLWRNFEGREQPFNKAGDRNFCVPLDEDTAQRMLADGWNVKYTTPRNDEDEIFPYLPVGVGFKVYPPSITVIGGTSGTRTRIFQEQIDLLDHVDIAFVDLMCTGYDWEVNGKTGTKAYLKTMFITINENALELKYAVGNEDVNG